MPITTYPTRRRFDREIYVCDGSKLAMTATTDFKSGLDFDFVYGNSYSYLDGLIVAPDDCSTPKPTGRVAKLALNGGLQLFAFAEAADRAAFIGANSAADLRWAMWVEQAPKNPPYRVAFGDTKIGNAIIFGTVDRLTPEQVERIHEHTDEGFTVATIAALS